MNSPDSLHDAGAINDFMYGILARSKEAMDLHTWVELVDEAKLATKLGVNNEKDYQIFHYIDVFTDDLASHIFGASLEKEKEIDLKEYMFDLRNTIDFNNLTAFFIAILRWISDSKNIDKKAYPNRGQYMANVIDKRDLLTWAQLAMAVRSDISQGKSEPDVLSNAAHLLPEKDRLDFITWFRFKFGKYNNVYDVNQKILQDSEGTMNYKLSSKFAFIHEDPANYYLPDFSSPSMALNEQNNAQNKAENPIDVLEKQRQAKNHTEARSKLVSRTFAIDRLLEKYHGILGDQAVSDIEDTLNILRKKIRSLRLATIVRDTMIKTANDLRSQGFSVGAAMLESEAHLFVEDGEIKKVAFDGAGPEIASILQKLQELSNDIKRRDIVKEIARIDLKLHDMNAYALFPELGEAQSKLIDATTYASNKLEDVIPKLRSLQQGKIPGQEPKPGAPPGTEKVPDAKKMAPPPGATPPLKPEPVAPPAPVAAPKPPAAPPSDNLANSI